MTEGGAGRRSVSKEERVLKTDLNENEQLFLILMIIFLVFFLGAGAGYTWCYSHQKGVTEVQLKEITEYPEYDYTVCGGCHLRKTMCEPNGVICGTWVKRIKTARHANLMMAIREVKPYDDLRAQEIRNYRRGN